MYGDSLLSGKELNLSQTFVARLFFRDTRAFCQRREGRVKQKGIMQGKGSSASCSVTHTLFGFQAGLRTKVRALREFRLCWTVA